MKDAPATCRMGIAVVIALWCCAASGATAPPARRLDSPIIFAQLPPHRTDVGRSISSEAMLRDAYGEGGRIVRLDPDGEVIVLTEDFASACEFDVSFDGTRILFAAQRRPQDAWNVWEMRADGTDARRITRDLGNCRSPAYQATLYTIVSTEPWFQIMFVSDAAGALNDRGTMRSTSLYSCRLDGSGVRRLTMNLSADLDPFLMSDGRVLLASRQRMDLRRGHEGRIALFGINTDGADYALYCGDQGRRIKHMPCETTGGLVVFVEADRVGWDGAGQLAGVTLRRPFYSYRPITDDDSLLYHSPSPLPDGAVLVAARPDDRSALHETVTHGVYRLDPTNGEAKLIYNDPRYHDFHAKVLAPRPRPDGRSSVVNEKYATGKLYCLNAYLTDPETTPHMRPGMIRAVRVIEGVPLRAGALAQSDDDRPRGLKSAAPFGSATTVQKRLLGLAPVEEDGSFHIEIPADVPVQLQTLDENGMALRSCGWIWVKHREPRGCIGCHEDPELTPENRFVQAMQHPGMKLTLPPEKRRTVDFRRDVMPIVTRKCAACHVDGDGLDLRSAEDGPFNRAYRSLMAGIPERGEQELGTAPVTGTYVHPGQARTSPLIWRLFGRNTSQPWDDEYDPDRTVGTCPPHGPERLTDAERLTFIEWIDLGAHMSGAPEPEPAPHPPGMAPSDENGDE